MQTFPGTKGGYYRDDLYIFLNFERIKPTNEMFSHKIWYPYADVSSRLIKYKKIKLKNNEMIYLDLHVSSFYFLIWVNRKKCDTD